MEKVYWADADYGHAGMRRETLVAASEDELMKRLDARGASLVDAGILWRPTVQKLTSRSYNARELSQVYRSLSRRVSQGGRMEDAFRQAASFVNDPLLRVVMEDARSGIVGGMRIDEAMRDARLPDEDCSLVRAMADAGGVADAFEGLGEAYAQRSSLRGKLMGVILQPVIYTLLALVMVWASFLFLIPRFAAFFGQSGLEPPDFIQVIYGFDAWVASHAWLSSAVYWGLLLVLFWFLGFSRFMRKAWRRAPVLKDLLGRAEAAQVITAFALLYESAMRRDVASRRVADSCTSDELRDAFQHFASELEAGTSQAEAARRAGFPPFVESTIVGALDANDPAATVEDLRVFSRMLGEDVEILSKRVETYGNLIFLILTGLMVFVVFLVTIYPEISVVLANA